MTLTRKLGALLLLLTTGSLLGAAALGTLFFTTASDHLYLIENDVQQGLIHQLLMDLLASGRGDPQAAGRLQQTIRQLDDLTAAAELGGTRTRDGNGPGVLELSEAVDAVIMNGEPDTGSGDIVRLLAEGMPAPPSTDVALAQREFREAWYRFRAVLLEVRARPRAGTGGGAYAQAVTVFPLLNDASRRSAAAVGRRIVEQRQWVLVAVGGLSASSLLCLAAGLIFLKRDLAVPLRHLSTADEETRKGGFSYRIPPGPASGLWPLTGTFNRMSTEIARLEWRYADLFENAADCVYTADLNGRILSANRGAERLTGYSRQELAAMHMEDLVAPEDIPLFRTMFAENLSGEREARTCELQCIGKDGRRFFVEASTRLIVENGVPVRVQGFSRDVTERRRLQQQLQAAQKMDAIGRVSSGVAHEFSNVLTVITGYSALILSSLTDGDPLRAEVEGIEKAAYRAASLIRYLQGFSDAQLFRPQVVDSGVVLKEMVDVLRRLIDEDIRIESRFEPGLGPIRVDPRQLEQAIVSLALTARDAMGREGVLRIEAAKAGEGCPLNRLTIQHTGGRADLELLPRIFDSSSGSGGTGLELSTVHAIVVQNGGTITVEPIAGGGACFVILLPRLRGDEPGPERATAAQAEEQATGTILVVEDEVEVRRLVRDVLRMNGYRVLEAENPGHAMDLCARHDLDVDLLLTDVVMPEMSGPELFERVQAMRPGLKVVFMSGHPRDRFARLGLTSETVHFLQKPLIPTVMAAKIREALDASAG